MRYIFLISTVFFLACSTETTQEKKEAQKKKEPKEKKEVKPQRAYLVLSDGDTIFATQKGTQIIVTELEGEKQIFEAFGKPKETKEVINGDTIWKIGFEEKFRLN